MAVNHLVSHYLKMRHTLDKIESGIWGTDSSIAKLTIGQVEHIKGVVNELEKLGIKDIVKNTRHAQAVN